jgi:hypothetical protein
MWHTGAGRRQGLTGKHAPKTGGGEALGIARGRGAGHKCGSRFRRQLMLGSQARLCRLRALEDGGDAHAAGGAHGYEAAPAVLGQ